jgi:hypothetical protein
MRAGPACVEPRSGRPKNERKRSFRSSLEKGGGRVLVGRRTLAEAAGVIAVSPWPLGVKTDIGSGVFRLERASSASVNRERVMDEVPAPSDSQKAYRARPRCGGGNLGGSPSKETQEGPGGGPSCVFRADTLTGGSGHRPALHQEKAEGTGPTKPSATCLRARCQTRSGEARRMCRARSEGDESARPDPDA